MSLTVNQAPQEILRSILQLHGHPDFQILLDYLAKRRDVEQEVFNMNSDPTLFGRHQGRVQALNEICSLLSDARQHMQAREQISKHHPFRT